MSFVFFFAVKWQLKMCFTTLYRNMQVSCTGRILMLVQVVPELFDNLKQVVGSSLLTVHVACLGLFGSTDLSAPLVLGTFSSWQVLSAFSEQRNKQQFEHNQQLKIQYFIVIIPFHYLVKMSLIIKNINSIPIGNLFSSASQFLYYQ